MDPFTAAFISYIELAGQYTAKKALIDPLGLEVSSISVKHQGIDVPFSYQLWRIRENSVCHPYKQNAALYSSCTVAASSLFQLMCKELQAHEGSSDKKRNIKNMYCSAAFSYEPTVANVQWTETRSNLEIAKRECNTAMVAALGSTDIGLTNKKITLCEKYNNLKQISSNKH